MNRHALGVAGGLALGIGRAIAADLQNTDVRLGRSPLEFVGRLELFQRRLGLFERKLVLLDIDLGQQLVLSHFQLRAPDRALGQRDLAVVVCACGAFLGFALRDLLFEILQLGATIERVLDLILPVEFDDQVAGRHRAARPDQRRNDEGIRIRPGEPWRGDGRRLHGFHGAAQPHRTHEIAADDLERVVAATRGGLSIGG